MCLLSPRPAVAMVDVRSTPLTRCLVVIYHGDMRSMRASEFKVKCLAILDEVSRTGESITILKCGEPVARLVPASKGGARHAQVTLKGTFEIIGDTVAPALAAEDTRIAEAALMPTLDLAVDEARQSADRRKASLR